MLTSDLVKIEQKCLSGISILAFFEWVIVNHPELFKEFVSGENENLQKHAEGSDYFLKLANDPVALVASTQLFLLRLRQVLKQIEENN